MRTVTCDACGAVCHPDTEIQSSIMKKDGLHFVLVHITISDGDVCLKCLAEELIQCQKLNEEDIKEGRL